MMQRVVRAEPMQTWYSRNKERQAAYQRQYRASDPDGFRLRRRIRRQRNAIKLRAQEKRWREKNKDRVKARAKKWADKNTERKLFYSAKDRARIKGLEFSILLGDIAIPESCPVLGIKLSRGSGGRMCDASPTLDRIENSKGYIAGNILVVSWRANRLKADASVDELQRLFEYYSRAFP